MTPLYNKNSKSKIDPLGVGEFCNGFSRHSADLYFRVFNCSRCALPSACLYVLLWWQHTTCFCLSMRIPTGNWWETQTNKNLAAPDCMLGSCNLPTRHGIICVFHATTFALFAASMTTETQKINPNTIKSMKLSCSVKTLAYIWWKTAMQSTSPCMYERRAAVRDLFLVSSAHVPQLNKVLQLIHV